jgi:hypothetical protein
VESSSFKEELVFLKIAILMKVDVRTLKIGYEISAAVPHSN